MLIGSSRDSDCCPEKGRPGWGRERLSEHSGRAFTGVGAVCQRPGAKRSRQAFRVLCGTGLDGPRSAPVPSSGFGMARLLSRRSLPLTRSASFFSEVFLGQLAGLPHAFHSHQNRPLVLILSHREPCSEFAARVALRLRSPPDRRRTKPGRAPDAACAAIMPQMLHPA